MITFCYFLYFFYLCKSDILALTLIYTQLNFDSQGIKVKFYFLAAYYRGFGIHPIFSRGLGIRTNKLYFPCRTNRMLALNSKNLNFHFATQSGIIIEKKTLLSQPWIKNSLWFLGNTSYSKKSPWYISLPWRLSFLSFLNYLCSHGIKVPIVISTSNITLPLLIHYLISNIFSCS